MKELSKVHSDKKNRLLEIVSAFRISPEICFSSTGTFFKTQSKLTHFIKSMFQKHEIVGPHIWQYIPGPVELSSTRYRSKMYDRIFKKIYFKFCTRVRHAQIS